MRRLNQISTSLTLAIMFLTAGCGANLRSGSITSPSSEPSSVAIQGKTARKLLKSQTKAANKEAILVLGGAAERERYATGFAKSHPGLPIWVSSGSPPQYAQRIFARAGIRRSRVHLDYQAVDTVTNFTSLVDKFQAQGINKVYLITSDYHMRRSRVIGEIVFGSRGIKIEPVPVSAGRAPEPTEKCLRDGARAILWVSASQPGPIKGQGARMRENLEQNYTSLLNTCSR